LFLPTLLLILTQFNPFSPPLAAQVGIASQYSQGKMQQVTAYRQRVGQIPLDLFPYDGFIAVLEADDIGRLYHIRPVGTLHWERFLAVDCAGIADGGYAWMVNGGIIAEVGWETAQRWGTIGYGIEIEMIPLYRIH